MVFFLSQLHNRVFDNARASQIEFPIPNCSISIHLFNNHTLCLVRLVIIRVNGLWAFSTHAWVFMAARLLLRNDNRTCVIVANMYSWIVIRQDNTVKPTVQTTHNKDYTTLTQILLTCLRPRSAT